eukprot:TRINITY_DN14552_c0_g2_i1.p1 TRINITY_DN14552_c0_g2~~TRINITY_DN14552_c0_g2_i1.p1  ORF type:complete len:144 (-),score=21.41 TRINITY_DN14552_c0_g2_i1:36-467(-)
MQANILCSTLGFSVTSTPLPTEICSSCFLYFPWKSVPRKWPKHCKSYFLEQSWKRSKIVTKNALPDIMTAAITAVAVGAATTALFKINQNTAVENKQICDACNGSGICSECKGEGFLLKKLSNEEVERARRNAKNAATRYTAG